MDTNKLAITQLDHKLKEWNCIKTLFQPKNGWIKIIRKTLGMTTSQLATRLKVNRSRVIKIETDESRKALTIKTLMITANALNCDFIYAFVPKKPLQELIEQQAYDIAWQQINNVAHNMSLEKQSLSSHQNQVQINELKEALLKQSLKKLWNDR